MKFSRIAAGIISTNAIQLQFLLNHALLSVRFSPRTSTIDISPHGKIKNAEGLCDCVAIAEKFSCNKEDRKYFGINKKHSV